MKFGFYSTHSVCLPTFIPHRDVDVAWAYSLMMILINFTAFFFIALAYALTFRYVKFHKTLYVIKPYLIKTEE